MKFTYNVVQTVEVKLDDDKYTEEFFEAFSEGMWAVDSQEDIAEYIARQTAMYPDYPIEMIPEYSYTAKVVDDFTEEA